MRCCLSLTMFMLVLYGAAIAAQHSTGAALSPDIGNVLQAVMTTSELVVGPNRFAFVLLKAHVPLEHARTVVRVYALHEQHGQLHAELPAVYVRLEVVEEGQHVHMHPDGTRHRHSEEMDVRGFYVAQVSFARAGPWGIEVLVSQDERPVEYVRYTVDVLAQPRTLPVGAPAPRSHNLIVSDVTDLREIDSSNPPDPRLHQVRIAEAIAEGKPQVILFATPKFCTSRVCGPVLDIVRMLLPTYGEWVAFTHQEIWQDVATDRLFPTVDEWHLQTEPWIFVVDGQGIIRAKFEGLTTAHELAAALQQVLDQHVEPGAGSPK